MDYLFVLVYCSSLFASFQSSMYLFNYVLLYISKKRRFKIKEWHYSFWSKILLIASVIFCLLFNIRQYHYFMLLSLLQGPVAAFLYIWLKQKEDYSGALINCFLKDEESIGAYWAHQAYDAYYSFVLKDLKERMETFEKENNVHFLTKKLVLVVPLSCNASKLLADKDENIEYIDELPQIECDQGANMNRTYKNPVYKIISSHDVYYIVAESPSPLSTLLKIKDRLGEEKFRYHRNCFVKTLKMLLEDEPCIVVEYDDTQFHPTPLNSFILSSIRESSCHPVCVNLNC